jgi:hypothetical protein
MGSHVSMIESISLCLFYIHNGREAQYLASTTLLLLYVILAGAGSKSHIVVHYPVIHEIFASSNFAAQSTLFFMH